MESPVVSHVFLAVSAVMFAIGICQLGSKKPVGFYSGETPPAAETLTDVRAYNRLHGTMWVLYGASILLGFLIASLLPEEKEQAASILLAGSVVVPLPLMICGHKAILKKFSRR